MIVVEGVLKKHRSEYDHSNSARKTDYYVTDILLSQARALVQAYHYAKGGSNTGCYVHGLHRVSDNELVGVAWWLPPTKVACISVHEDWKRVVGLTRLVVAPNEPKNAATILLGASIAKIRKKGRFVALVTYADMSQGHTGQIYRATNWLYKGTTKPAKRWINPVNGQQVATKATITRKKSEMQALGYEQTPAHVKHKFVMYL